MFPPKVRRRRDTAERSVRKRFIQLLITDFDTPRDAGQSFREQE
jgi:hypothetical protein